MTRSSACTAPADAVSFGDGRRARGTHRGARPDANANSGQRRARAPAERVEHGAGAGPLAGARSPARAPAIRTCARATSTPGAAASACGRSPGSIYDPIYKYWFRAEWEGLEHIPHEGGALLVANHAAAIPSDAPVIMHGIEKELERPVYGLAENLLRALPVVGTHVVARRRRPRPPRQRVPAAARRPAARARLPRGHQGHRASCYRDRYKLHRFGRGGFVEIAMRSGVPVDPDRGGRRRGVDADRVEERPPREAPQHPVLPGHREHARVRSARSRRLLPRQVQAPRPAAGALRRPPRPGALLAQPGDGRGGAHPRDASRRRSTTCCAPVAACGSASADARPRHRARHVLGRPASRRSSSSVDDVEVDRRRRHARARAAARAHRVRARRLVVLDPRAHRARHAGRHDPAHAPHRRLHEDQRARAARDQRHRHHEPARGGRVSRQPGAQGRREELDARVRLELRGPVLLPRGRCHAPAAPRTSVERSLPRARRSSATSPTTTRTCSSRCCGSRTCSATTSTRRSSKALRMPGGPRDPRLRPAAAVRARGRRRRRADARHHPRRARASTTSPATAQCRGARSAAWSASAGSRCRRCSPTSRPSRCGSCGLVDLPPEMLGSLRYGRGVDNSRFKRAGFRYGYTTAGTVDAFARGLRLERAVGDSSPSTATSRTSRSSSATPPPSSATEDARCPSTSSAANASRSSRSTIPSGATR